MTIEELKTFFANHPVPKNTMLNAATKILDPVAFLGANFGTIESWKGNLDNCPGYWHLCDLVRVLELSQPKTPNGDE